MERLAVNPIERVHAGDGLAKVDTDIVDVDTGDYLRIEGDDQAIVRVIGESNVDGSIRVDGETRHQIDRRIGQDVAVEPADISTTAHSIKVSVPEDMSIKGNVSALVRDELLGQAVWPDAEKSVGLSMEAQSEVPISVEEMAPNTPSIVTETTEVEVVDRVESETTPINYDDVGGLDEQLEQIREMVELPIRHPELFERLDVEAPNGILLHGPPGTGKTLMAKAVANENESHFESISGPEIMSKYYGESENRIRQVFERAAENAPAIVFIDEIDSIAPDRDETGDTESRVVAQLLALMDGLDGRDQVTVMAATNRVDGIDPALRRPGRFDREVEVGVPDKDGRRQILSVHARNTPLSDDVDLDTLAAETHGFVGADLENLVRESAMNALRRVRPDLDLSQHRIPASTLQEISVESQDVKRARQGIEPSAMREVFVEVPDVEWDDVGGLESTKQRLEESVEWPLSHAETLDEFAVDPPSGILLYGPPGTGKTLMAKAVANESNANFISVQGPELLDKYVGESEKGVREIFKKARENAPTVLFFDELDAIAVSRGSDDSSGVTERVVSQILTELDGLQSLEEVTVVATTNRPDLLDNALMRPGRLSRQIHVPVPDEETRADILSIHSEAMPLNEDVDLDDIAARTDGFVGADIESLCREASMAAARERITGESDTDTVTMAHFEEALDEVHASVTDETREKYEEIESALQQERTEPDEDRQLGAAFR